MNFVGEMRISKKRVIFELENVKKCEERVELIKDGRRNIQETTKFYVTLKTGEELLINIKDYKDILKYKNR